MNIISWNIKTGTIYQRKIYQDNYIFATSYLHCLNCSNKITIKKLKFHKKVQIIRKICKQVLMNTIKEKP